MSTPVSVQSFNKLLPIVGVRFRPLVYDQVTGQFVVLDSAGQLGISGGGGDDPRIPDSTTDGTILIGDTLGGWAESNDAIVIKNGNVLLRTNIEIDYSILNSGVTINAPSTSPNANAYLTISGNLLTINAGASDGNDAYLTNVYRVEADASNPSNPNSARHSFFGASTVQRANLTTARASIFAQLATLNGVAAGLGDSLLALFDALGNNTGNGMFQTV